MRGNGPTPTPGREHEWIRSHEFGGTVLHRITEGAIAQSAQVYRLIKRVAYENVHRRTHCEAHERAKHLRHVTALGECGRRVSGTFGGIGLPSDFDHVELDAPLTVDHVAGRVALVIRFDALRHRRCGGRLRDGVALRAEHGGECERWQQQRDDSPVQHEPVGVVFGHTQRRVHLRIPRTYAAYVQWQKLANSLSSSLGPQSCHDVEHRVDVGLAHVHVR